MNVLVLIQIQFIFHFLKTVALFMSMLLDEVKSTNKFEKRDLGVGARIVKVSEIIADLHKESLNVLHIYNVTVPRVGKCRDYPYDITK